MNPLKLATIVGAVLFGLLVLSKATTMAFALVSAQDDISVLIGFTILFVIAAGSVYAVARFARHIKNEMGLKKTAREKTARTLCVAGLLGLLLFSASACTRVPAGYAGVKINYYGSNRGVQDVPMVTGWVWYNPFTQKVFEYPCFVQTAIWTANTGEGHPVNEELTFNVQGGIVVKVDISLAYQFLPERVPAFYLKFRSDDIDTFTHGFLRNIARDAFNEIAPAYTVEDLYGSKKEEMINRIKDRVNGIINPIGAHLEQFGFTGAMRLPDTITEAMNNKARAIQDAIRVENELRQQTAEAAKVVAKAKGEAEANALLTKSISPELIQWRMLQIQEQAIQKWNGQRPQVESGGAGGLLMQIPMPTPPPHA
jgi:regulator of protease activity HflC (stomatin/prohibitin superfamily)